MRKVLNDKLKDPTSSMLSIVVILFMLHFLAALHLPQAKRPF